MLRCLLITFSLRWRTGSALKKENSLRCKWKHLSWSPSPETLWVGLHHPKPPRSSLEMDKHTNTTEAPGVFLLLCCSRVPEQVFTASLLSSYGQSKEEVVVTGSYWRNKPSFSGCVHTACVWVWTRVMTKSAPVSMHVVTHGKITGWPLLCLEQVHSCTREPTFQFRTHRTWTPGCCLQADGGTAMGAVEAATESGLLP